MSLRYSAFWASLVTPPGPGVRRGDGASDWPAASQTGDREQEHVPQGGGRKPEANLGAGPTGNRPTLRKPEMQSQGGKRGLKEPAVNRAGVPVAHSLS